MKFKHDCQHLYIWKLVCKKTRQKHSLFTEVVCDSVCGIEPLSRTLSLTSCPEDLPVMCPDIEPGTNPTTRHVRVKMQRFFKKNIVLALFQFVNKEPPETEVEVKLWSVSNFRELSYFESKMSCYAQSNFQMNFAWILLKHRSAWAHYLYARYESVRMSFLKNKNFCLVSNFNVQYTGKREKNHFLMLKQHFPSIYVKIV